jgi:hypothetical protein
MRLVWCRHGVSCVGMQPCAIVVLRQVRRSAPLPGRITIDSIRRPALRATCVQLGGARSYASGLVRPFRETIVLPSHLVEVVFERGGRRISSQPSHACRVLAVVIRR